MELRISVRGMVEFLFRNGDIDNTHVGAPQDAMQEGSRIHKMIQKRAGLEYEAEVPLVLQYDMGGYTLRLEGRADGVITHDNGVTIDEIKSTYRDVTHIEKPSLVHLAQAKCYAYMYLVQNDLQEIRVRMTYCNIDTEELRFFHESYKAEEIISWFEDVMKEYKKWTDYTIDWQEKRGRSLKDLKFPYGYREGQKDLVENVYKTIYHSKKLFIQAPTGVGKTLATLYPTVMSMSTGLTEKIFYLTAKTITGSVAVNAYEILRSRGMRFKSLQITAKEKVCMKEKCECNPVRCEYARGHYDRVNEALYDLLTHEEDLRRETIAIYAGKHKVCPFELCLDASLFADGIICDYNYLFDPHVYLKRFFADGVTNKNYTFLIDEAHNLLERGRDMYSAVLVKENFLAVKRILKEGPVPPENKYVRRIIKSLDKCNAELLALKKNYENENINPNTNALMINLQSLYQAYNAYFDENLQQPEESEFLDLYFDVSHYLAMYEEKDDHFVIYTDMDESGSFIIKLFCIDPSRLLARCMERGRSSILFSATFLPIQYYKKLLGGDIDDYEVYAHSVFDPDKRGVFIGQQVTSLYTRRTENEYARIATYIRSVVEGQTGNYMVFCPSYAFMSNVWDAFEKELVSMDNVECIIQDGIMGEAEREAFLARFSETRYEDNSSLESDDIFNEITMEIEVDENPIYDNDKKSLIGFCVLGGIFSEGIDLKGDSLIGAIIVGTGLPQVCKERELIKNYFDSVDEDGFDYAYRFPGMNKVLQAAGRVIRTAEDVGVVALLDERFCTSSYSRLFPREWNNVKVMRPNDAADLIKNFWTSK